MAFNSIYFSKQSGDYTPTSALFAYTSSDSIASMQAVGYFNPVVGHLNINDLIRLVDTTNNVSTYARVSAKADGAITIVDAGNIYG